MTGFSIGIILAVAYLLTWSLIPWVLLQRRAHPSAAVAWLFAILFLPFLGPLLFGIFGTTRWERRSERKQAASAHINAQIPQHANEHVAAAEELDSWGPISRLITGLTDTKVLKGNQVEIVPDVNRSFDIVEEAIAAAEKWIHVEFYIWRPDDAGTRMRDLLIRRAKEGLQVRLLYDGVGSMWLSKKFLQPLKHAGVQVAPFTPGLQLWHVLSLNLRNHRKIVVTDQQTAFTGGMNIGDEYVHPTKAFGHWRDTQLRLQGPAAFQFQQVFAQDWFYATGEELTATEFYPEPVRSGDVVAQVVADGPDNDVDTFYLLAVAVLGRARERVTLTTPYFVPPDGLSVALASAARRGVRVRMMVADRGNYPWTRLAGRSYYESLLQAGVEIFEYEKGLCHAKTLTVDGRWSLVGTPNWDYRSLILNFEIAVALYDAALANELERQFQDDQQYARRIELDSWKRRSTLRILQEQFWRLFAPTL